jgi:hypothetical protein
MDGHGHMALLSVRFPQFAGPIQKFIHPLFGAFWRGVGGGKGGKPSWDSQPWLLADWPWPFFGCAHPKGPSGGGGKVLFGWPICGRQKPSKGTSGGEGGLEQWKEHLPMARSANCPSKLALH